MQKITPFLWFNENAEEAVNFYVSLFKKSKIGKITRYDDDSAAFSGLPQGSVMSIDFRIEGMDFAALNGGPVFTFSSATSFVVNCKSQKEVDYYWDKILSTGGTPQQCGWIVDRFGVTWQIVPVQLMKMLLDKDKAKSQRVMQAMLKMVKLDVAQLERAYQGK